MGRLEEATKKFLEVRKILDGKGENFALARAYKKPLKWYKEQSVSVAVEILEQEAKQN